MTPLQLRDLRYWEIDILDAGGLPEAVTRWLRQTELLLDQMIAWKGKVQALASYISQQQSRWYPRRLERLCRYTGIVGSRLLLTHPSWFSGSFPSKAVQLDCLMQRSLTCTAKLAVWL